MALWPINLRPWSGRNIGRIRPADVLVEFEEPLTFTFLDEDGSLLLAHLVSRGGGRLRYVVAPTTRRIVEQLTSGARSILAAIDQPMVWVVDVGADAEPTDVWVGTLADVPPHVLPSADVMLYTHLTPMLRLRAIGDQIEPGSLPARVVRSLVAGAETAVRHLTNFVTDHDRPGRPDRGHRQLYQLQAQQFAFHSFEIAFRPIDPNGGQLLDDADARRVVEQVEGMLSRGLRWAQTGEAPSTDARENQVIFEAIRELSSAQGSPVSRVEVGGRVAEPIGLTTPILSLTTRRLASESVGRIRDRKPLPNYVVSLGRVRMIDVGRMEATVESRGERQVKFRIPPDLLDDVLDGFNARYDVTAVGVPEHGRSPMLVLLTRLDELPDLDVDAN